MELSDGLKLSEQYACVVYMMYADIPSDGFSIRPSPYKLAISSGVEVMVNQLLAL